MEAMKRSKLVGEEGGREGDWWRHPGSVDVRQVGVVPAEVASSVEPVLGAGVGVSARLEPPGTQMHTVRMIGTGTPNLRCACGLSTMKLHH